MSSETSIINKARRNRIGVLGTEIFFPRLLKEKEPFVKEGSVDVLARLIISTLNDIKSNTENSPQINTWESVCTSAKIANALTREGITDHFSRGLVTSNSESVTAIFPEMQLIYDAFKPNTKEVAMASAVLLNKKRPEEITLVTTGGILSPGHDVHIAIMTKSSEHPDVITITHDYFENAMKFYKIDLTGTTLNSAKKQFVAHQAFVVLLHKIRGIKEQIPFQLRQNSELFSKYNDNLMQKLIKKLIDLDLFIGFGESLTGGLLADELTNYEGGETRLRRSDILYDEEAKRQAGVKDFALNQSNVYSDSAATELARAADKPDVNVAVGITGLSNTDDSRTNEHKAGEFYYSIQVQNKREHKKEKPYKLPIRERLEMKEMCSMIVYRHLLKILSE
jgi:nicotinamide mononucleotide (NMN) deamidase PncC